MKLHNNTLRQVYVTRRPESTAGQAERADAVTTQILRNALNSAANQMKRVLIRTSFSPTIYEALDFAVAMYDREIRMLAQAPTLPAFTGTMSFCVEAAIEGAGGAQALDPGDLIIYNLPYGTGSHAPDAAIVMPVFHDGELVGYVAAKGHLSDIGAKNPYCSDTTDIFQEGVIFPGIKLYRRGELVDDVMRMILANSRAPQAVKGDVMAEIACCHAGAEELLRVIERFGLQTFRDCTERMYEHGEAIVRDFISRIPDGRYKGVSYLDNDGISDDPISFEVELVIEGDAITFDLSGVPDANRGPLNCPFPSTASACRIVMAMLAGNEASNEGHFMPLQIITRTGSMFHPVQPQPCFMYGWPFNSLVEALFEALSKALPGQIPSGSAGDICGVMFWAFEESRGELLVAANPLPVGLGAFPRADGSTMFVPALAQSKLPSAELQETKWPFIQFESWELAQDSAGPGQYRGGLGWDISYRMLRDVGMMTVIERTKEPSWGQGGGLSGRTNKVVLQYPDGRMVPTTKVTGLDLPKDTVVHVHAGGGGGYGEPASRDADAIRADLRAGLLSEESARAIYPHAFA
ncbi:MULTISPECIES: hydantoinase B/oxoprolinase family protein [unclassified Sphingomonas]|uniref:hydantoinase B/oxoprolinase family protein n=1 Tax=unclassified Sphingomonas TaxID=196159 RepID=UPI000A53A266|nr:MULTISPECIES: hydantoinase B/oxoprolinase family protein [unclassified Sphingomonas]